MEEWNAQANDRETIFIISIPHIVSYTFTVVILYGLYPEMIQTFYINDKNN